MSKLGVTLDILNQKGTPAFYSDIFTNRPAASFAGRVFISTDTGAIYEDTGSTWTLIADAGAGTTGTLQQVTTNGNTTTLGISVQGLTIGKGAGAIASNTAVGSYSLGSNTTGSNNTAVGYQSLNANTTGGGNTAIGFNSLKTNTTGASNTAVGYSALSLNLIGVNNAALGYNALCLNTGNSNTAVGAYSLGSNTTATNNTAVGNSALSNNTTAAYNTAIGSNSLQSNLTGEQNTVIGYNSGSSITTGSNNTILGSYAGTAALASHIVLSDGAANVRLYSNATGLIGINQAVGTPSAQLDIHTTQTYGLAVNGTGTSNAYLGFANAGTYKWRIGNTYNAGANSYQIYDVLNSTARLTILNSGATTINGALTSTSVAISGGTSAQILAGDGSVITAGTNITISGGTISASGGMAIGGSITSATEGSVLFAGASGVLAQNNANFFWDNTNTRLGIGTTTIGSTLQVNGNATIGYLASTAAPTNGLAVNGNINLNSPTYSWGTPKYIDIQNYGTINTGDDGTKSYINIGYNYYEITPLSFRYKVGDFASRYQQRAGIHSWYVASSGTANATITFTQAMTLDNSANLGIGTTTIGSRLQVNGNAAIGYSSSTAAPTNGLSVAGTTNIGTNTSVTTALLQVSSTTQGFLPPVMTTTQKNAISSPATGLVVFDSTLGKLCVFSTTWQTITSV